MSGGRARAWGPCINLKRLHGRRLDIAWTRANCGDAQCRRRRLVMSYMRYTLRCPESGLLDLHISYLLHDFVIAEI